MFKGNGAFTKFLICFMMVGNVIFTVVILVIFCKTYSEPSTLVQSWFMFTCGEAGVLGLIKIFKVKNNYSKGENEDGYSDDNL